MTDNILQQWPADLVVRRPIADLFPAARNARTHSAAQVKQLSASMLEWGWTNPVLVDEQGVLIAGHCRIVAAKALGWLEAPVMVAAGWTDAQKRAYALADNNLPLGAAWDENLLRIELDELKSFGFDAKLAGFEDDELREAMSKSSGVSSVDVTALQDRFWISIRGPMKSQALALAALRKAMAGIVGVQVELGTLDAW